MKPFRKCFRCKSVFERTFETRQKKYCSPACRRSVRHPGTPGRKLGKYRSGNRRKYEYLKIGSKFKRKYGRTLSQLSRELGISQLALSTWDSKGLNIFDKATERNAIRGNRRVQQTWVNMNQRCSLPSDKRFNRYGGRGIRVKMTRLELVSLWNRDKASEMKQPSIDRIDNDGHYEYSNCRFIEMSENVRRRFLK